MEASHLYSWPAWQQERCLFLPPPPPSRFLLLLLPLRLLLPRFSPPPPPPPPLLPFPLHRLLLRLPQCADVFCSKEEGLSRSCHRWYAVCLCLPVCEWFAQAMRGARSTGPE